MRPVVGLTAFFVFHALTTDAALAEKMDSSAGYFLPHCRAVVDHEYDKLFDIGICSGVMVAIHDASMLLSAAANSQVRACMPDSLTVEEIHCGCCALVRPSSPALAREFYQPCHVGPCTTLGLVMSEKESDLSWLRGQLRRLERLGHRWQLGS